jgi:hypothetical protein
MRHCLQAVGLSTTLAPHYEQTHRIYTRKNTPALLWHIRKYANNYAIGT